MKPETDAQGISLEAAAGLTLLAAAVLALIVANSPLRDAYERVLGMRVMIGVSPLALTKPLLLWINDGLMAIFFFVVGVLIPPVKADSRFQDEEDVVTGSLDFPDCLRNPVGFGEGIVNRVSQLLHEVLQWLFHRFPLMADAPETTGVPPMGPHPPVPIVVDQTGVLKRVHK